MKTLCRFQYILFFIGVLAFCGYRVKMQFAANDAHHIELREAFVHLWAKRDIAAAQRIYVGLIEGLGNQSTESLIRDQKRTALLASTSDASSDDLVWRYYSSLNKELEKRRRQLMALNNKGSK